MSKLNIIIAPDERLNQLSKEVKSIDNKILDVLDNMLECMYLNNGIGLAAPQVGILKRLVVVDCGTEEKKPLKFLGNNKWHMCPGSHKVGESQELTNMDNRGNNFYCLIIIK